MFIARRRGLIVGMAVGAAVGAAASRGGSSAQAQPAQTTTSTTVYVPAQPQQGAGYPPGGYPPQSGYPPGQYQNYPPGAYPPPPSGQPAGPGQYPPPGQGYPPGPGPAGYYPPGPGHQQSGAPPPPYKESPGAHPQNAAPEKKQADGQKLERRYFALVNDSNCCVLEVCRDDKHGVRNVRLQRAKHDKPAYQMWYLDKDGFIRSKIDDMTLVVRDKGDKVHATQFTGDARQQWIFQGNKIVNSVRRNECIGLKKGLLRVRDDADIISSEYDGKPYQHWRIDYA